MNGPTEFLLARIAEDEEYVRRAQKAYQHVRGIPHYFDPTPQGGGATTPMVGMSPRTALAECEAKRRIVERCALFLGGQEMDPVGVDRILEDLTLPYADHPDYRQEWKP